jgi:hypothetical protein
MLMIFGGAKKRKGDIDYNNASSRLNVNHTHPSGLKRA